MRVCHPVTALLEASPTPGCQHRPPQRERASPACRDLRRWRTCSSAAMRRGSPQRGVGPRRDDLADAVGAPVENPLQPGPASGQNARGTSTGILQSFRDQFASAVLLARWAGDRAAGADTRGGARRVLPRDLSAGGRGARGDGVGAQRVGRHGVSMVGGRAGGRRGVDRVVSARPTHGSGHDHRCPGRRAPGEVALRCPLTQMGRLASAPP